MIGGFYKLLDEEKRDKWDRRYLKLAQEVSKWSRDPSTKVGAVIVKDNRVVATGYNGFPQYVEDTDERYLNRDVKYKLTVHAELNAILVAGHRAKGATIYVWPSFDIPNVCHECAKSVIQSGITRVVGYTPSPEDKERAKRWSDSISIARMMLTEAEVRISEVKP